MITLRNLLDQKGRLVYTVSPDIVAAEALAIMAERNIGALVVVEDGRVIGLFSERDFARLAVRYPAAGLDQPVRAMMTTPVLTVPPGRSVEDCMGLMTQHRIRHLPVCEDDSLLGVVSIGDLVKAVLDERNFVIKQLENYITGAR